MEMIFERLSSEMVFWMAWVIIPLIIEIVPSLFGFLILLKKRFSLNNLKEPIRLPEITLIVPVYNSSDTLRGCLESIYLSNYPNSLISIMVVNNESKDDSFNVFTQCQNEFKELSMQWLNAKQGKSKALNMALFNSEGKYIVHIDSDGKLHPDAIRNIAVRFEQNKNIDCLTGAILSDYNEVEKTKGFWMKLLRRTEFFEYCQAFLAGRNFESEFNNIYTLSGAFSAFRKSTILKTQLYNTDTVCEDTQVTFQVRELLKKNIHMCENALFFVDPIENFDKLYTQRQRWQRGEIEVAHMFLKKNLSATKGFFSNFMVRLLMIDHTFAFPRMIWYFALICLVFLNYPMRLIFGSVIILYLLYILAAFLYFLNICLYLEKLRNIRKYYISKWYIIFILPLFNFIVFWIRLAGIINCIRGEGRWKTSTLTEEWKGFTSIIKSDFLFINSIRKKIKDIINHN